MSRLITLLICSMIVSSCSWVSRDYYYQNENASNDWATQYISGKNSDKSGIHPALDLLTFEFNGSKLIMHISYQDMMLFGPIIPFIPAPFTRDDNLMLEINIQPNNTVKFNPFELSLIDLDTGRNFHPASIYPDISDDLIVRPKDQKKYFEINEEITLYVRFPIGVNKAKNIKINVGTLVVNDELITPSAVMLQKIKGDTHFNQFTL
ncbi:MAG: hypothetical protein JKX76_03295 [Colwellia sp.]|nr:hypothetical protein [Colwellia sp.]